jgi:hypothetical protein
MTTVICSEPVTIDLELSGATLQGRCWPLRHPSRPGAWGWRTVQSELGDGIS